MLRGTSHGIVGFDPTTIPGCTVWFDAADTGTMSLSGTSVQTWRSKGSASCTAVSTFNAPIVSTIGGLSALYFNGVSTMMKTNTIASYGATETTWITCAANLATVSGSTPADACPVIATSGSGGERAIRYTCNVNATVYTSNTPVLRQSTGDNTNGVRGFIDTAAYFAAFTNGSLVTSNTTAVTFQAGVNQSFVMGQWNVGWLNGYVYEILIYNRALTLGEYQSVEGYLAQKWRFTTANFKPTSIPGCILWLDPATQGNLTYSGANVTAIKDSSTLGNNATRYNGASYATTATVSGNTILSFPGAGITYRSAMVLTGSAYTIFTIMSLVSTTGNGSGYQRVINADSAGGLIFVGAFNGDLATFCGSSGFNDINANTPAYTLTGNGIQLVTMYVSGSTLIPYINGTAQTTKTGTTGATTVLDIGAYQTSSQNWNGYIGDVIIYNTALTTAQRQQVEGYLAWKWGLKNSLPSTHPYYLTSGTLLTTHPYYSVPPQARPFTPIDIPGCQLWLDGADTSIIGFSSGNNVNLWKDKSGNNLHASNTSIYPTYSGSNVVFNGSQQLLLPPFIPSGTKNITIASVWTCTTASTGGSFQSIIEQNTATSGAWWRYMIQGYTFGGRNAYMYGLNEYGANPTPISSFPTFVIGTPTLSLISQSSTDGINFTINNYSSGSLYGSQTYGTAVGAGIQGTIGSNTNVAGGEGFIGSISEIIIFTSASSALTPAQSQSIEGYLGNKWGLKASMPAFVNPRSIPGCALWFDGNDPAGTGVAPANGASVSAWVNKGTTAVTMAYGTSQPTFSSNFQNGFGSVAFNGNYFSGACSFNLAAKSGFLVCSQSSSVTDSPQGFLSFYGSGADTVGSTNGYGYQASQGGPTFGWLYDIFSTGYYLSIGGSTNTPIAVYSDVFASGTQQTFKNGTAGSTATPSSTPGTSTTLMLGARLIGGSLRGSLYGNICEVIVYNVGLSIAQRQTVEGYLAWKWGLQASLPTTHPFYATMPLPHPFYKVPPTVRQPALYYDVAPGNWARDWQPYLKALAAANATGVSVAATNITGGATFQNVGWYSGILGPDRCIYCAPAGATTILKINVSTGVTTNIASFTAGGWYGGALGPDGNIYFAPTNAANILKLNLSTGLTTNITGGATYAGGVWTGGTLGPDGNIYYTPYNGTSILKLNVSTGVTTNITGGATYTSGGWYFGVLGPDGCIYFAPYNASNILKLNVSTGVTTNITGAAIYTTGGWQGGVVGPDGNIYFAPSGASNILKLTVSTGATSNITGGATYGANWNGGALGPDGCIYFAPYGGTTPSILKLNVSTGVTTNVTGGAAGSGYGGGVLAPDGNIYFIPFNATNIVKLTFSGLSQLPSLNYCLSAYANKS